MAIQLGQQLGNYKLISLLGGGGFGKVYLGKHIHIGTFAAIKVLDRKFSQKELDSFKNEARTIKSLKHSHIVQLLEFGIENNVTPFIVMDYAPNGTLQKRHQGSRVPLMTLISYVKPIAAALQYAHDKKIIHRDIKPANIFIGQQNEILVGDFGIAVIAHSTQTMTPQSAIGTFGYAAPEQAQGKARPASDQYSLGIMVYEWLSGMTPPFPPGIKISTISPAVEQVIFKALETDPKKRYPKIQDFAIALEKASNTPQPQNIALPQNIVLPQNMLPPTQLASPAIAQLQGLSLDERLYREGLLAQSAGDVERAGSLWEQALSNRGYSNQNRGYSQQNYPSYPLYGRDKQLFDLLRDISPKRIAHRVQQAKEARSVGDWQREIAILNEIIQLKRGYYFGNNQSTYDIEGYTISEDRKNIARASQNLEYKWLYEHAQQLINNGDRDAAKGTLKMLWQQAPYYGDPLGLAKKAGTSVSRAPLDPDVKAEWRSALFLISLGGMFFSSIGLFVTLILSLLSPVINWANDKIGYHQRGSYPDWLWVVLLIADLFFFVLYLFTRSSGEN